MVSETEISKLVSASALTATSTAKPEPVLVVSTTAFEATDAFERDAAWTLAISRLSCNP
jgi:hypothetical protein